MVHASDVTGNLPNVAQTVSLPLGIIPIYRDGTKNYLLLMSTYF